MFHNSIQCSVLSDCWSVLVSSNCLFLVFMQNILEAPIRNPASEGREVAENFLFRKKLVIRYLLRGALNLS